jgi:hypothetical protein
MRRIRDPQLNKIYPDPEGAGHLTKGAYRQRKEKVDSDHETLHNNWQNQNGMPQQFDVGRLKSPMWQKDRDMFKPFIKEGSRTKIYTTDHGNTIVKKKDKKYKTTWESKYEHPVESSYKVSTAKFLNMEVDPQDVDELPGDIWVSLYNLDDILKRDFENLKHKTK